MLHHECLDACDDYHFQRQQNQLDPSWDDTLYGEDGNTMGEMGEMDCGDDTVSDLIGLGEQKR